MQSTSKGLPSSQSHFLQHAHLPLLSLHRGPGQPEVMHFEPSFLFRNGDTLKSANQWFPGSPGPHHPVLFTPSDLRSPKSVYQACVALCPLPRTSFPSLFRVVPIHSSPILPAWSSVVVNVDSQLDWLEGSPGDQ